MAKTKTKPCPIEDHSACEPLMDIAHKFRNYAMRVEELERENGELRARFESLRAQFAMHTMIELKEAHR